MAEKDGYKQEMDRLDQQLSIIEGTTSRDEIVERNWSVGKARR